MFFGKKEKENLVLFVTIEVIFKVIIFALKLIFC